MANEPRSEWTRPKPIDRAIAPVRRAKRPRPVWALFYDPSVRQIMEICCVTRSTAYSYKNGNRKPSAQAVKLIQLHINQRVLGREWARWRVHGECIIDPDGNITTVGQLHGYAMLMQCVAEWTRDDKSKRDQVEPIYKIMDAARRRA